MHNEILLPGAHNEPGADAHHPRQKLAAGDKYCRPTCVLSFTSPRRPHFAIYSPTIKRDSRNKGELIKTRRARDESSVDPVLAAAVSGKKYGDFPMNFPSGAAGTARARAVCHRAGISIRVSAGENNIVRLVRRKNGGRIQLYASRNFFAPAPGKSETFGPREIELVIPPGGKSTPHTTIF